MTLVSEVSSRPPNRRAVLAAAAVMATGGWAQQALAGRGLQPIVQTYNFLSFLAHGLLALHLG